MITCKSGVTIRTSIATIREAGRATQGVKLIRLDEGDEIAAITKLNEDGAEEVLVTKEGMPDDTIISPKIDEGTGGEEIEEGIDDEVTPGDLSTESLDDLPEDNDNQ